MGGKSTVLSAFGEQFLNVGYCGGTKPGNKHLEQEQEPTTLNTVIIIVLGSGFDRRAHMMPGKCSHHCTCNPPRTDLRRF